MNRFLLLAFFLHFLVLEGIWETAESCRSLLDVHKVRDVMGAKYVAPLSSHPTFSVYSYT